MILKNCALCGDEFSFKSEGPKRNEARQFCSISCSRKRLNSGCIPANRPTTPCLECGNSFLVFRRRTKYCSTDCSKKSIARLRHISAALVSSYATSERKSRLDAASEAHLRSTPTELLSEDKRRKKVLMEQGHTCNRCHFGEWLGQPIVLEIEHKDGDHYNNIRENLEALCPNCHSLTPTWRGRNKTRKVSDDEMIAAIKTTSSLRQALVHLKMAGKGGNYKRITRLAEEMKSGRPYRNCTDDLPINDCAAGFAPTKA